jgi:hypothetical protein
MKRSALSIIVLLLVAPVAARAADPLEDFADPAAAIDPGARRVTKTAPGKSRAPVTTVQTKVPAKAAQTATRPEMPRDVQAPAAEAPAPAPAAREAPSRELATSLDFATDAPPAPWDPATSLDFPMPEAPVHDLATSLDFATPEAPEAPPAAAGAFAVGSLLFTFK